MSDYTIVNLGDVENVAPKFQMPEGMDVRFPKRRQLAEHTADHGAASLSREGCEVARKKRSRIATL